MEHVLTALPEVLQNKNLILSANPALNTMTSVLCHMVRPHISRLYSILDPAQTPYFTWAESNSVNDVHGSTTSECIRNKSQIRIWIAWAALHT